MAFKPFTGKFGLGGKAFYASALQSNKEPVQYSSGGQTLPHPYSKQIMGLSMAAAGITGVGLLGTLPYKGSNVFSKLYMPAIRGIEEFSPLKIMRTGQVGNFLSQFADSSKISRIIPGQVLNDHPALSSYYSRLTGKNFDATRRARGIMFHEGKLYHPIMENGVYRPGELLLSHASYINNTVGGASRLSEGTAREIGTFIKAQKGLLNIDGSKGVFSKAGLMLDINGKVLKDAGQFVGANTAAGHAGLLAKGFANAGVERFNLLSRELPQEVVHLIDKIPGMKLGATIERHLGENFLRNFLGTVPGKALPTLGKVAAKWTLAAGALWFGADLVDKTLNRVGLSPVKLAARTYVGGRLMVARAGELSGVSYLTRKQEEIAPGSTNPVKLAAFPLMGYLAGSALHYAQRANIEVNMLRRAKAVPIEQVGIRASRLMKNMTLEPKWFKNLSRWIEKGEHFSGLRKFVTENPGRLKGMLGLAAGLVAVLPLIPGAVLPQKGSGELADIYSGRKEIAVRKGRWWELGRSSWEGGNIQYFRPHWFPLLMSGARDKSIYGAETSKLSKFYQANFTYNLERKHFYDRPYPIAGAAFEDVPLVGPILAATVGRLIKSPIKMHTDEYKKDGEYLYQPPGFGKHIATELGEVGPGAPINPYGVRATISNQFNRFSEMTGLWGFFGRSGLKATIGQSSPFAEEQRLQSSRTMFGMTRDVWDRDLGGGGPIGEVLRRVFPHPDSETPQYNPIQNTMPSWLPGSGERGPDLQHGDPYAKIRMGDVRLPGAGFEALHPELSGIDPEDYPDIWKFKILSDVAPYTDKTQMLENQLTQMKKGGSLSEDEMALFETIKEQTSALRDKREFTDYKYEGQLPTTPWGMLGKYWETLAHGSNTSLEFSTPLSPFHKMIHMSTAIEDYQDNILYGKQASFWNKPIDNFLKPTATSMLHGSGLNKEGSQGEVRNLDEYFDALKYIKYTKLRNYAAEQDDYSAVGQFEEKRHETLVGVNPFTQVYSYIFRALPRRDRDYFSAFTNEQDPSKQEEILSMVPRNERGLLMARWRMAKSQAIQKRKQKGEAISADAESFVNETYEMGKNDGVSQSEELHNEFIKDREPNEQYADWYRRSKVLPLALNGKPLPGPDWVGWHPSVDLNDIKLKVVEELGQDMHDFDFWQSDEQALARKPFINTQAAEAADPHGHMSESQIRSTLRELLSSHGVDNHDVTVTMYPSQKTQYNVDLDITQDRSEEAKKVLNRGV